VEKLTARVPSCIRASRRWAPHKQRERHGSKDPPLHGPGKTHGAHPQRRRVGHTRRGTRGLALADLKLGHYTGKDSGVKPLLQRRERIYKSLVERSVIGGATEKPVRGASSVFPIERGLGTSQANNSFASRSTAQRRWYRPCRKPCQSGTPSKWPAMRWTDTLTASGRHRWNSALHARTFLKRDLGRKIARTLERLWAGWQVDSAADMAAEISFYFALSCFPFLMVLTALVAWLKQTSGLYAFSQWLTDSMPLSAQEMIMSAMADLSKGNGGILSFGLLLTIWSASTGFLSLMKALSKIYGLQDGRSYVKRRAIAIIATFVMALFLLACFGVWSAGHLLGAFFSRDFVTLDMQFHWFRWLVTLAMVCVAVDLINYFLPSKHLPWRWISPGSVLTTVCFILASALLSLYVNHNPNMARIYGTLTGFIVMMLWIYLINLSILLGAQTDAAVAGPVRTTP
jgi:membrane protein